MSLKKMEAEIRAKQFRAELKALAMVGPAVAEGLATRASKMIEHDPKLAALLRAETDAVKAVSEYCEALLAEGVN